nr:MAG TPA: hypothetical protein [Caudoviricetes sp.]
MQCNICQRLKLCGILHNIFQELLNRLSRHIIYSICIFTSLLSKNINK